MLNLDIEKIERQPFDHVSKEKFISPELYAALCEGFPQCPSNGGPTGHNRFWGDPEYEAVLKNDDAWRAFFGAVHSQNFIDYAVAQFGHTFQSQGCLVNLARARYVPYQESRADKERRHIAEPKHDRDELWVRLDLLQGKIGYNRARHLDHRRRLITLLVYFCDADENRMVGGEVIFHPPKRLGRNATKLAIVPRHNLMVAFPCSNESYHSVARIKAQRVPRNYVQITISSSFDAWPPLPVGESAWNSARVRWHSRADRVRTLFRSFAAPARSG